MDLVVVIDVLSIRFEGVGEVKAHLYVNSVVCVQGSLLPPLIQYYPKNDILML